MQAEGVAPSEPACAVGFLAARKLGDPAFAKALLARRSQAGKPPRQDFYVNVSSAPFDSIQSGSFQSGSFQSGSVELSSVRFGSVQLSSVQFFRTPNLFFSRSCVLFGSSFLRPMLCVQ